MAESSLQRAQSLLVAAYGKKDPPADEPTWRKLLRVLLGIANTHPASNALTELLTSSALVTPREAAATSAGQLVELLQPIPRGPQKSSVIRAVASWWLDQFGDELTPEWTRGLSTYRESLRAIRGLGPATVDELLLFAAGLPVFPLDRPALYVAARHGWLDLPIEDEEAQSFFVRGADHSTADLQDLSLLLTQVGAAHCGREPKCEGCPLQPMLPNGKPLEPH